MTAAMDYGSMGVQSEFGAFVCMMVVVWGLILLSMLVAVVFELVVISSYEGWAIGWIAQMELLQQERDRASSVIGLWYKMLKATWEREKGAKLHTNNPNAIGPETAHAINMVKRYKQ